MTMRWSLAGGATLAAVLTSSAFQATQSNDDVLAQARNLGKAFYENPTTQAQSVDQFKKALDMMPNSARERVNYGISLLHNAKTAEGIAELERRRSRTRLSRTPGSIWGSLIRRNLSSTKPLSSSWAW